MKARVPITRKFRNRSKGRCSGRKLRFTELIRFRNAMKPNRIRSAVLTPRRRVFRSAFWYSRTRAFSSSGRAMSALLLHVPDHEDESELAQRDHEPHDDVEERDDEPGTRLANQRHDRHDHDEEERERDDDRDERFREHPQGLHLLPHLQAVLLLELLRLQEEVRLELAAARGRRHDALEEVLELRARGALRAAPDRVEDVHAKELRVPRDPFRLLRDLAVDGLLRELLEDHVHGDVRGRHRGDEGHRSGDSLVDPPAALLRERRGLSLVENGQPEGIHVRDEDRERGDEAENRDQRADVDANEGQEEHGDERGDHRGDRGDRRVHPRDREVLLWPEADVRPEQVVLELLVFAAAGLDERAERLPCELLPRCQPDGNGLRALGKLHEVVTLLRLLLARAEPLRLREGATGLELFEGGATQRPHLPLRSLWWPSPASPSRPGSASRSPVGTGSTRSRSWRSRGNRVRPSRTCSSRCRPSAGTPAPSPRGSCSSSP